jgi:enamine deaminase RidA (YjgF/YER057c/UK114 family)
LNAEANFKAHSKLADYASDLLVESFDVSCIGSRTAVGVETLPSDASVEVNLVVAVSGE